MAYLVNRFTKQVFGDPEDGDVYFISGRFGKQMLSTGYTRGKKMTTAKARMVWSMLNCPGDWCLVDWYEAPKHHVPVWAPDHDDFKYLGQWSEDMTMWLPRGIAHPELAYPVS